MAEGNIHSLQEKRLTFDREPLSDVDTVHRVTQALRENPQLQQALTMLIDHPYDDLSPDQTEVLKKTGITPERISRHDLLRAVLYETRYPEVGWQTYDVMRQRVVEKAKALSRAVKAVENFNGETWAKNDAELFQHLIESIKQGEVEHLQPVDWNEIKLGIVNYLEAFDVIRKYRQHYESLHDQESRQAFLFILFGFNPEHDYSIEFSPSGIVVQFFEEDFKKIAKTRNFNKGTSVNGLALLTTKHLVDEQLQRQLYDKLVLINKGPAEEPRTTEEIDATVKHEKMHLRYYMLHMIPDYNLPPVTPEERGTKAGLIKKARIKNHDLSEEARDEILAYGVKGTSLPQELAGYGGDLWLKYIGEVMSRSDSEVLAEVSGILHKEFQRYLRELLIFLRLAQDALDAASPSGPLPYTKEEVISFLAITPFSKAKRLARILGLPEPTLLGGEYFYDIWQKLGDVNRIMLSL